MSMSRRQAERQRHRRNGKYARVNPCYLCNKSAGEDYTSHPLTDANGSDGVGFGDMALCICAKCYEATKDMTTTVEVAAYSAKVFSGPLPTGDEYGG